MELWHVLRPYEFMLPAYMVHPEPKPRVSTDGYVDPRQMKDRPTLAVTIQTAPPNGSIELASFYHI